MFYPKVIEKVILCRSQHSKVANFVILSSELSPTQRFLCQSCSQQYSSSNIMMVKCGQLQYLLDNYQREKIKQFDSIFLSNIRSLEQFIDQINSIKTKTNEQLDSLLSISNKAIQMLIDEISSYSFYEELEKLISNKIFIIDSIKIVETMKTILLDWNFKVNLIWDQFKNYSEFRDSKKLIEILKKNINDDVELVQSQPIIKIESYLDFPSKNQQKWRMQSLNSFKWDFSYNRFIQTKYQIKFPNNNKNEMLYILDGVILRCQNSLLHQEELQQLNNIEQIQYLKWIGDYGQNKQRIGRWAATWNGEVLQEVGGIYNNGEKQGFWKEPISNYWAKAKAYQIGEYKNNVKRGFWKFIYKDQDIGGGEYNVSGEKNGIWIELSEGFFNDSQVTYKGKYKNGKKNDKWETFVVHNGNTKMIGGGQYDTLGVKYGLWIDISKEFQTDQYVTYQGQFQNGRRVGQWKIFYSRFNPSDDKMDELIGGGFYDQGAQGLKVGQWIDISNGFNNDAYVTYHGQYILGQKVGRWDIYYRRSFEKQNELIGGGLYDENGSGNKIKNWIELADGFKDFSQVIYQGQYINGKKVGRWEIKQRYDDLDSFEKIGGGQYDEANPGMKVGDWIEISDEFNRTSQVMYYAKYKNGKKVGECKIMYKYDFSDLPSLMQNIHTLIKYGLLVEEDVTMKKETKQGNGQIFLLDLKINYRYFNKENIKMEEKLEPGLLHRSQTTIQRMNGGGSYDQEGEGNKVGKWIDICEGYSTQAQIIYDGEYKNGKKAARWKIKHRNCADETFVEIGGGAYDEYGIKFGNWTDISDEFKNSSQIILNGQYENGKKKGMWTILYQRRSNTNYLEIGGGVYDQENYGLKHGKWIQLSEGFSNSSQLVLKGEYKKGQKVGLWESCFRERIDNPFQLIGQGCYDQGSQSIKNGIWTEPIGGFWDETQIISKGKYSFSKKIGVWVEKKRARGNVGSFQNLREIVYDD
ncbi:unnamed protein product [Paramecium octaurelia]|uniref:Uncharacterized protein n=1 Tax=Paramecium octaurelia TaxID=43137 RepID=A0A8S1Y4E4_PAROT|nr:unnamed protein product [Paramecium octaurelia]